MKKKNKKDNKLITRKNLKEILRKHSITRVQPEALDTLEEVLNEKLEEWIPQLSEHLKIKGTKTLTKQDVKEVLKTEPKDYPEI